MATPRPQHRRHPLRRQPRHARVDLRHPRHTPPPPTPKKDAKSDAVAGMGVAAVLQRASRARVVVPGPSRMSTTIFVADDDPVLLRGLDVALQGQGYAVQTAPSGPELLSLLEEGSSPDLLVLDVMMPGMSGLEVLRRIRED